MNYNLKGYSQLVNERYIKENKENSKVLDFKDVKNNLESYFYDELNEKDVSGYPCASAFENSNGDVVSYEEYSKLSEDDKKDYRLKFYYHENLHEIYIGTTGSGKTTSCIEPQLRALSSQKNKPNLFISDPKGEIFEHNAKHLKDNGYKVQVLNFKDTNYSNCFNPLGDIYDLQEKMNNIGASCKSINGKPNFENIRIYGKEKDFINNNHFIYDDLAFASKRSLDDYLNVKKGDISTQIANKVHSFACCVFPDPDIQGDNYNWLIGSRNFLEGLILGLLDQTNFKSNKFKKEMLNINTIEEFYLVFVKEAKKMIDYHSFWIETLLTKASEKTISKLSTVYKNKSEKTVSSYLSEFIAYFGEWTSQHIASVLNETNITFDDKENPIAYFIISKDYDKSDNKIISLFLNAIYEKFLIKAENSGKKNGVCNCRKFHFLLDEFGNIPAIKDFETKIATSRSRNMFFHLFLQSYEQLDNVYGPKIASIIIDNCNQQNFLGSQSIKTKQNFINLCGYKTATYISSGSYAFEEVPVLLFSDLDINNRIIYSKRNGENVMKCSYVRSYECANEGIFKDFSNYDYKKYLPINVYNPKDKKFKYDLLDSEKIMILENEVLESKLKKARKSICS